MSSQRTNVSFSPQVLHSSLQRSPLGHTTGRFGGELGRGGTSFRDTVIIMVTPPSRGIYFKLGDNRTTKTLKLLNLFFYNFQPLLCSLFDLLFL